MKKDLRANIAIEAAIILPLVLVIFCGMISTMFYCHDKNIVTGAAYEVLTVASREKEPKKEDVGKQLQERLNQKLILFSKIYVDIWIEDSEIIMRCTSTKNGQRLSVQVSMSRTEPETYIRNIRKLYKVEKEMIIR